MSNKLLNKQIDVTALKRRKLQLSLYDFVQEFWGEYEHADFVPSQLSEFQAECFMFSVRGMLPDNLKQHWITQEEYKAIRQNVDNPYCPIRDKPDVKKHDFRIAPRHSKSTTHTIQGPVWLNTITPAEVLSTSHTANLAVEFNEKRQQIIDSDKFKTLFPDIKAYRNKVDDIKLSHGGRLYVSTMGTITGKGGDVIINDDLVSAEGVRTDKETLERARKHYKDTVPTRLNKSKKGGDIVWHIAQRLGPNDVSGLISSDEVMRDQHSITEVKAIQEEDITFIFPCSGKTWTLKKGDPLWRERFGNYEAEKKSDIFETQYQQNPTNSDLMIFKPDMIKYITQDEYKAKFLSGYHTKLYSVDFPVKGKDDSDFLGWVDGTKAYSQIAITNAGQIRTGFKGQKQLVHNRYTEDPNRIHLYEDKANGAVMLQDLADVIPGLIAFSPGSNSKETRADVASNYIEDNVVFVLDENGNVPKGIRELITQMLNFPYDKHDDMTDALVQKILYVFNDAEYKVYSNNFNGGNIEFNANRYLDHSLMVGVHKFGSIWKVLEIYKDFLTDSYIIYKEHLLKGEESDIITRINEISRNAIISVESGRDVSVAYEGKILVDPNYLTIKDSIPVLNTGFARNQIRVSENCHGFIRDVEIYRYSKESVKKGSPKPETLNDGFVGCLRAVIAADKGLSSFM